MIQSSRRSRALLAVLVLPLVVLLSGCVRMTMSTKIVDDNTITVAMDLGIKKSTAAASGQNTNDMCSGAGLGSLSSGRQGKVEQYDDGTYVGCKISGSTRLSEVLNEASSGISLTHANGEYVYTVDLTKASSGIDSSGAGLSAAIFDTFVVSVTFPGSVVSHSGDSTVSGTTVTWNHPSDYATIMTATGKDNGTVASTLSTLPGWAWAAIAVAALAVAGLVVFLVLRRNKKHKDAAARAAAQQAWQQQQPYPGQAYPGQPDEGQPYPGQQPSGQAYPPQYPGQQYPGQQYPGQQYAAPPEPHQQPAAPQQSPAAGQQGHPSTSPDADRSPWQRPD